MSPSSASWPDVYADATLPVVRQVRDDPMCCALEREVPLVEIGDQVEVHTKFSDSWVGGFEIAEIVPDGYRVRRKSDGSLLPGYTSESDVRPTDTASADFRRGAP